ncbi:MAG TPA: 2-amino-4-hydroxy-6-hydroxymethyldihydropteridine diphosphokinase [Candidatus Baltobacteraceae bacterium]|nr:2-amino-4-hydroxy-6-hydroxymethyldihydropteridine diphosphokinase [Candidatus Baltobacteraceae bacterium]
MPAAIGLGSNLGAPARNVRRAMRALWELGTITAASGLYRSKAWGKTDQPDFCNAAVLLETALRPRELLMELKRLERRLGRKPGERWGPRVIDLDILTYDDLEVDEPDLCIPHPRLSERAFALVPLAEIDPRFEAAVAGLPPGETVALMSEDEQQAGEFPEGPAERVRALAAAFRRTDLIRLRIEDENEDAVELRRRPAPLAPEPHAQPQAASASAVPLNMHAVKADLVGVFRFSRPPVSEGEVLEGDRELAYVDALGIRNPVRSLGGGRIVSVFCEDGQPVEYGQVLFEIDRG